MRESLVYNIPVKLIPAYRGHRIIVRSHLPWRLVQGLAQTDLANVSFIQLLSLDTDVNELTHWGAALPVDVVMVDPTSEFPLLYKYSKLLDNHPVRISIPLVPGLSKAVKQAIALNFAVKLEGRQPQRAVVEELLQVLELYLHRASVSQPIEYFHGLFLSFFNHLPTTLWEIQEEDPAAVRYVTDDGEETISPRFVGSDGIGRLDDFILRYQEKLLSEKGECHGCEFFDRCGSYFKWPNPDYSCTDVKMLLGKVKEAADELHHDVRAFTALQGGPGL